MDGPTLAIGVIAAVLHVRFKVASTWLVVGGALASFVDTTSYALRRGGCNAMIVNSEFYAMGGNMEAVKRSGYNIRRTQFFIYCYVGLLASIMGIIHVSLIRYSNATYIIDSELLHVIAAVVLGGASILGGSGTLTGTLLGVVMISILEKNLVLLGLSSYWQQFFVGLIIVLGVSITHIQKRIQGRRSLALARE